MKQIERAPDLRSQIYQRLRDAIRVGEYPPGTRFLENEVAKDLGVSRTPAREALALLTRDGILIHDGRSFCMPEYDAEQIAEVFEIRQRLEPYAVRLACERASAEELKALRALANSGLSKTMKTEGYVNLNLKLRQALFSLCKNRRLEEMIHLYDDLVHYVRVETLGIEANRELSIKGWRKLISAIATRKADVAEATMSQLLKIAYDVMLTHLEKQANAKLGSKGAQ